jgi:aspartyl-tRNA(Asn)/glutamyl-tRNA(Gln) amidotransferase subunit C
MPKKKVLTAPQTVGKDIDVAHIAKLARIAMSPEELKKFQGQLTDIVSFISQLQEVDVTGVEPTAQVTGLEDVLREDVAVPQPLAVRNALVEQMPQRRGDLLEVPQVFDV